MFIFSSSKNHLLNFRFPFYKKDHLKNNCLISNKIYTRVLYFLCLVQSILVDEDGIIGKVLYYNLKYLPMISEM